MRMNQPSVAVWLISLLLAGTSLMGKLGMLPVLAPWSFLLMGIACGLLLLATLVKGL